MWWGAEEGAENGLSTKLKQVSAGALQTYD